MKNREKARESIFKKSQDPEGIHIKGYDFSKGLNMKKLVDAYK